MGKLGRAFRMIEKQRSSLYQWQQPMVRLPNYEPPQVMAKMDDDSTMVMTSTTSRGTIFSKLYFSNEFVILVSIVSSR